MDLKVSSGKARQHLGYMAQKFSLYGNLTVEQNLRFFSGVYGLRGRAQNEKIRRMSDAFGFLFRLCGDIDYSCCGMAG